MISKIPRKSLARLTDDDMIPLHHPTLIAPAQVDVGHPFPIMSLLPPVIRPDNSRFSTRHTVGRYHPPLGKNGDVQVLGELDIADTPVTALVSTQTTG